MADRQDPGSFLSEQRAENTDYVTFGDNRLVADLSGEHDAHLMIIEETLGVQINPRGNRFAVTGPGAARARARWASRSRSSRSVPT